MKKIFLMLVLVSSLSFAISLNQVRSDLNAFNICAQDSVEMSIRTIVESKVGKQIVSIYLVQKGISKSYSEIRNSLMNQRSIVNGNRMKVIDLNTNKARVLPYNGEALEVKKYMPFNPLESGDWQEPVAYEGSLFMIKGTNGTLYYDSKKKRIEKIENNDSEKSVLTTFSYDEGNNLKKMVVSVLVSGVETIVTTEILALRSSVNFPDKLFDF